MDKNITHKEAAKKMNRQAALSYAWIYSLWIYHKNTKWENSYIAAHCKQGLVLMIPMTFLLFRFKILKLIGVAALGMAIWGAYCALKGKAVKLPVVSAFIKNNEDKIDMLANKSEVVMANLEENKAVKKILKEESGIDRENKKTNEQQDVSIKEETKKAKLKDGSVEEVMKEVN